VEGRSSIGMFRRDIYPEILTTTLIQSLQSILSESLLHRQLCCSGIRITHLAAVTIDYLVRKWLKIHCFISIKS
jgi:hypothetical protein